MDGMRLGYVGWDGGFKPPRVPGVEFCQSQLARGRATASGWLSGEDLMDVADVW